MAAETKKRSYEYCVVPLCTSSTVRTPNKRFITVPKKLEIRKRWFNACRRKEIGSLKSTMHICEDHFDVENDCCNVVRHSLTGCRLKVKDNILPHIFDCQPDRKQAHSLKERSYLLKKRRKEIVNDCLNTFEKLTGDLEEGSGQQISAPLQDKTNITAVALLTLTKHLV